MKKEEKQQVINELSELFTSNNSFYLADTTGLTVEQVNKLRRLCFKEGIKVKMAKNTLIKKALEAMNNDYTGIYPALKGSSSIMVCESPNAPAKIIKEFRKTLDKPQLKAAYIEASIFIGDNQLETLANLKSKGELIGEIIGLLQSPAQNVISALQSGGNKLGGILKTLSERN